jgi:hypothetical protein
MTMLADEELEAFVQDGFVRLDGAVPRTVADRCRAELWQATGCDPADRSTWTEPVVRLDGFGTPPFREAANTEALHEAFDQLVGPERWYPRDGLGTFSEGRPEVTATGRAGDVILCHPFLVHAAQPHHGSVPRFMGQPPLVPTGLLDLSGTAPTPVERAVLNGLAPG